MGKGRPKGGRKRADPDKSGHAAAEDDEVPGADGLTPRQAKGVEALVAEPVFARAAEAAGVDERTLRRWWREPAFNRAVRAARRQGYDQASGMMQKFAPVAVATLVRVMQDAGGGPSAKVSAATALLKLGREAISLDDVAARVEALEQAFAAPLPQPTTTTPDLGPEDQE